MPPPSRARTTINAGKTFFIGRAPRQRTRYDSSDAGWCQCAERNRRPWPRTAFYLHRKDGNSRSMDTDKYELTKDNLMMLSDLYSRPRFCFHRGSIFTWFAAQNASNGPRERFGIFIGLWVPSFFILSNRLARKAEELEIGHSKDAGLAARSLFSVHGRDHVPARHPERSRCRRKSWSTWAASVTRCSSPFPATTGCRNRARRCAILTHLQVREDAHILFGFMTVPERDLFRLLVNNVSGIGPKLALALLSGMSGRTFQGSSRQQRHRRAFQGQRRRQEDGGTRGAGVAGQARRRRDLGSGQQRARAGAGGNRGQRRRPGADFARLQTSRSAQGHQADLQSGGEVPKTEDLVRLALKILA